MSIENGHAKTPRNRFGGAAVEARFGELLGKAGLPA